MSRAARLRTAVACAALVPGALMLAACSGGGSPPLSQPGDVPPTLEGPPTDVDVCNLITPTTAAAILDRPMSLVGVEYGAPQVPTFGCMLGQEFGVPLLQVELAVGPVAAGVFEDAYGEPAGGDPVLLRKLGDGAFLRAEKDQRTLHVYVSGSVLSLRAQADPAHPVKKPQMVALAEAALVRVPANPQLAATAAGPGCADVDTAAVAAAIGAAPSLEAGLTSDDGSVMCSWASRPGSATATVIHDPQRVAAYRDTLETSLYTEVDHQGAGRGIEVWSLTDRAGDLLIFDGTDAMAYIDVVPSAGFSGSEIVTTPGEHALAEQILDHLL